MIYIHPRRTLDWRDEAAVEAGLVAKFRPKVELWNATFNIRYHSFRQRLHEIARLSWSRIQNACIADEGTVPENAIIVPVDDDDWFSPELGNRLGWETDLSIFGYHWIRHILEPERRRRSLKGRVKEALTGKVIFATNNYALRKRPEIARMLSSHLEASNCLHERPSEFRYLPLALSVHNRSIASQTALGTGLPFSHQDLLAAYSLYRRLYDRTRLFGGLSWARPYVAMMSGLMQELKLR